MKRKKGLTVLWILTLLAVLLPGTALAAPAELYIGDTQVTDGYSAAGVSYTGGVLTLNGASLSAYRTGENALLFSAGGDLTIRLIGTNTITGSNAVAQGYGIKVIDGSLTFTGPGSLTVSMPGVENYGVAVYGTGGSFHMAGGGSVTVSVTGDPTLADPADPYSMVGSIGIDVQQSVRMQSGTLNVSGKNGGVFAGDGNVEVSGGSLIAGGVLCGASSGQGSILVSGGSLLARSTFTDSSAVTTNAPASRIAVSGGVLTAITADQNGSGLWTPGSIDLTNAYIETPAGGRVFTDPVNRDTWIVGSAGNAAPTVVIRGGTVPAGEAGAAAAAPKTGDEQTPLLWCGLLLLCGAGLWASSIVKKRRFEKQ